MALTVGHYMALDSQSLYDLRPWQSTSSKGDGSGSRR
jgi:hypothetical protein